MDILRPTEIAFPGRVLRYGAEEVAALGRVAKQRAADPAIFDEHPPVFFPVEGSSNRLDSYFTKMARSSLQNYAADALAGVSFQDSHRTNQLGLGATIGGRLEDLGDALTRVVADVYTLPGLPDLDAFIFRYRAGIAKDVSIGFYNPTMYRCSLCGNDIYDYQNCPHIPGVIYDVEKSGEQGDVASSERVLCFAWVEGARLSEISAVYDGATPGAAILKAQIEAQGGRLTEETALFLENRYSALNVRLRARNWPGLPGLEGETMTKRRDNEAEIPAAPPAAETEAEAPKPTEGEQQASETETEETVEETTAEPTPVTAGSNSLAVLVSATLRDAMGEDRRPLDVQLRELAFLAKEGRAARTAEIERTISEAVRAHDKFDDADETRWRRVLAASTLDDIRAIAEDFRARGDAKFPAGRQTSETPDNEEARSQDRASLPLPARVWGQ